MVTNSDQSTNVGEETNGTTSRRRLMGSSAAAIPIAGELLHARRAAAGPQKPQHLPASSHSQEPAPTHVQAIVTAHEMATEAGFEMLEAGGTAADASVAIASVLTVVEPWFSSVFGGGTWALYFDAATGEVTSLDGVGPVGRNVDVDDYESRIEESGIHQAIVPGAWDGWMVWLERYGRLNLSQVLNPAIEIARDGHPVSGSMAFWLGTREEEVLNHPPAAAIYAPEGELLKEGDTVVQADLANTFQQISRVYTGASQENRSAGIQAARDFYYRGPLAEAIVAFSDENNGYLTLEDFADFEAEIVDAISIDYTDDIAVFQNPPNSQGITQLLALNILKGVDFSGLNIDDPDVLHAQIESLKLAFADRYAHIGDPARIDIPVETLLSDEYAEMQRARVNMDSAMEWPIQSGVSTSAMKHTSTFHVVDGEGNGAAVTTSIGAQFLVIGDTGIHINQRMPFLSLEPGNPNQLTPGYKVRHTSNPYLVLRDGALSMLGGNTGADTQPQAQTQQFISVVDFGLSPQRAIDRPRFVGTSFPNTSYPYSANNDLQVESGLPGAVIEALEERGHQVVQGQGVFGSAGMIEVKDGGASARVGVESRLDTASGRVVPPAD